MKLNIFIIGITLSLAACAEPIKEDPKKREQFLSQLSELEKQITVIEDEHLRQSSTFIENSEVVSDPERKKYRTSEEQALLEESLFQAAMEQPKIDKQYMCEQGFLYADLVTFINENKRDFDEKSINEKLDRYINLRNTYLDTEKCIRTKSYIPNSYNEAKAQ